MTGNIKVNWKRLILAMVISIGAGVISWLLTGNSMELILYGVQLVINIGWSVIFFNFGAFWLAFVWLMILWILIIFTIWRFFNVNTVAAWLMVPYLLWVTFAAYLNIAVAIMN